MILIKPLIHTESQSSVISPFIFNTFPTSLGYLAGYLREYNKIVPRIIDEDLFSLNRERLSEILQENKGLKIVGISVVTVNSHRAYQLAKLIKDIDKEYLIVLGGIHATVLPDESLGSSGVDIVVRGEGEKTFSELVRSIQNGDDYASVEGISYRKNGKIAHNPNRPLIDLELLPLFPYDLFDSTYGNYRDFGSIISSRGCPYDCIFCSQRAISGRKYRYVSNEKVLREIELLINNYSQKKIWFLDDNFLVNKKRAFSLLEGIIERGYHKKVCFCTQMRGESVDYEILNKMKQANFQKVGYGMETGSQRLLDLLNKREKVEDNIKAIKMTHKVGIKVNATFIFGIPTERRSERLYTARLARKLPLDDARFNIAVPYPGTKLFDIAKKENRLLIKPGWSNFNVQFYMFGDDIAYVPENTNKYKLMFDTFIANLRFLLRPKTLISFFTSPLSGGMVVTFPKKWYFSPREILRFFNLVMLILKRFFVILLRSFLQSFKKQKTFHH